MNKLIWSTFAVSLMLFSATVLSEDLDEEILELEILPKLEGPQKFTDPELHQKKDWRVDEKEKEVETAPFKGQNHSLILWDDIDPLSFLSIEQWMRENEVKSKNPEWKVRLRLDRQLELVGKILSCTGKCEVYRGTRASTGQYLSDLIEGDELRTDKNSVAWVYLIDSTIMRLGADSSISLQEINLGREEIFMLMRLNHGHVFWHPRYMTHYPQELGPETDSVSLPLRIPEANQQHFEREIFKSQSDSAQVTELMEIEDNAIKAQIKRLNELKELNGTEDSIPTRVMMVAPNATIVTSKTSFDLVHVMGGSSYLKRRQALEDDPFSLFLRGYNQTQTLSVTSDDWQEVNMTGRSFSHLTDVPAPLQVIELITRRIRTLELAREIWMARFSDPILRTVRDKKYLAYVHGYSFWGEEGQKRFDYLLEYTRRIETTNLRSIDALLLKLQADGQAVSRELSSDLYEHALNHYLKDLKTRYTARRTQVREMNDLQYYVWTLKNGKL